MYGREYERVTRKTFLFNKKGNLVKIYSKVRVKSHSKAVLKYIKIL